MGIFEDLTKPISQQSDTSDFDFDAYLQEKIKPYKKKTVAPDPTSEFAPEKVTSNIDKITEFFSNAGDALVGAGWEGLAAVPAITEYGMKQAQRLAENPIGAITEQVVNNPISQLTTKLADTVYGTNLSQAQDMAANYLKDKTKGVSTWGAVDKVTGNKLSETNADLASQLKTYKDEFRKKTPDSFWGRLGASAADMVIVGGASVGTGFLTSNPQAASAVAMGLSSALEGGALYDTLKEKGLSEDEALKVSGQWGAIIGLLDSYVPGKLGAKAAGEMVKKTSGNILKKMAKSEVITEIGTENLQNLISTAVEYNYSTDAERQELIKRIPQEALETTAMSALMGGAMQVVGKGLDIKNKESRTKLEEEFGTGEEITTETVIEPEQIAKPEVEEVKLTPEQQLKKERNDAISAEYKATIKNIDDSKAEIRREVNRLNGELKIAKNNNEIIDEKRISGELAKLKEQLKSLDSQRKTAKEDAIKKIGEVENLKENEPKEVKLLNARKTSPELTSNATEPNYRTQPLTVEERYDATNEMKLADKIKNLRVKINDPKVKNKKELKAELKRAILQLNEISRAKANKQLKETNFEQQTADLQKLTPTEATEPQTPAKGMEVKPEVKEPVIEETKYEMRKSKGGWSVDKKENNNWGFVQQFRTKKEAQNYIDSKQKPEVSNVKEKGETLLVKETPETLTKENVKSKEIVEPLIEEAKKYKSADEFVSAQFNRKPEYGMGHRPTYEGMPPAHNLLEGEVIPKDVYVHPEWSVASNGLKDKSTYESWAAVKKIKDNPDADVTVYRAAKKNELNNGDWITFSKNYAKDSIEPNSGEKVYSFKIKAKDAIFAGDDINEFGYYPKSQLTDIWNKANTSSPVKKAVKAEPVNQPSNEKGEISKIETDNNRPPRTKDEINKLSIAVKQLESEIEKLENLSSETVLTDKAKYREVNDRLDEISPEYWHKKQLLEAAEFEQEYLGGKEPHEVKKADFDEAESAYSKAEAKRIYNKKKINANTVKEFIDKHGGYSNLSYSKYKEKHDGITISQKGTRKKKYIVKQDAPQSGFYQPDKYTEFNSIEDAVNYVNDIYKERYKDDYSVYDYWELGHKDIVRIALKEGKSVPPEVLKDYPELTPSKDRIVEPTGATGTETPVSKEIITDPAEVQRKKNSIAEGELIVKTGKIHGRKLSVDEIDAVKKQVAKDKAKIGLLEPEIPVAEKKMSIEDAFYHKKRLEKKVESISGLNPRQKKFLKQLDKYLPQEIKKNLSEGKPVSEEVLKDYPEPTGAKTEPISGEGEKAPASKRVFSEEGYKKDRKDANDILNRPNFIGAQLEAVPQMLRIAGYHLENIARAGVEKGRQFTEWTKSMIKDLGGKIRPYLKKIWEETQRQFGKKLLQYAEKNPFIRSMNVVEGSLFTNDNLPPVQKYTDKDLEVLFEKNPVVRKKVSEFTKKTKETADDILRPMSAEIEQIDKDTYTAIKENDFETLAETNRRIKQITPFLEKFVRFRKYQPKEFAKLSYYLTANNMVEAEKIMSKWKMSEAFKPVRDTLNELYVEGVKVKYDLGYLKDYFPRDMVDYEGYLKEIRGKKAFDVFQELIDKKNAERKKKGEAVLTTDEENKLITNAIRGYNPGISLSGIANYKERVIKAFPPSYAKYYDTAENALINYIVKATDAIQQRKLFGYGVDAEASIASYIKGKGLDAEKSAKLKRILKARYNFMSNKWASQVRGIMYLTTLNNPTSSIKNLADVPMALYNSGSLTKTFVALGRALVNKSVIKMEDAGLHNMGGEYMNLSSRNKATNAMMKWMLAFPYFDKVGKETYINATMSKYHKLANSNPDKLKTKLGKWFNEERATQVVSDLRQKKSYKDIGKTNLLNLVAYLEISDVQPTTMTEMPLKYAESPNGRVLYTMKSFQLKRLDFFRKETLHKIRTKGQRLEGFRNLAMLTTMIGLGEAGTEQIISWLLGRDESFTEQIADSMLSIIGFNRYDVEKAKRTNPIDVIFNKALPIATPLKDLWDDYETAADNYELTRYLTTHKTDRPFKAKSLNALPWVRTIRKNIEKR